MRAFLAMLLILVAGTVPSMASLDHGIDCRIDDENLTLDLLFGTGYGGYGFSTVAAAEKRGGTLEVRAKGVPPGLRSVNLDARHLKQSWLYGREFRLELSWMSANDRASLVIEAVGSGQDAGASPVYGGSYVLTVGGGGQTLTLRGRVRCEHWYSDG